MSGPYPREFREDFITVARNRQSGVTIKLIDTDFGISEAALQNWLRGAHHDDPTFGYRYLADEARWLHLAR